jgi:hypothetical protein
MVVGSCVVVFAVSVTVTAEREHRHTIAGRPAFDGPPIARMAQALDVPADRLRSAFETVGPPSATPRQPPTDQQLAEHSRKLAVVLNMPVDRLRSVLSTFKPPRP